MGADSNIRQGDVLGGRYRIEGVIGVGGMGVVFAARQIDLDRRVAVKVLASHDALPSARCTPSSPTRDHNAAHPQNQQNKLVPEETTNKNKKKGADDAERFARFAREARALSRLTSPNVSRLLDVGTLESGAPFFVMELLEGQDLSEVLKADGPLAIGTTIHIALQVCDALEDAHGAGIVHRDIKPANLFLATTAGGRTELKVLDFGISKLVGGVARYGSAAHNGSGAPSAAARDKSLTHAAQLLGSPLYMSPEQLRATRDVDARTDVWSLGVVLHELLSGKAPFDGDTFADICARILVAPAPSLSEIRPDVSKELAAIVLRCLEKEPALRYANVAELATALRELKENTNIDIDNERPRAASPLATAERPPPLQRSSAIGHLTVVATLAAVFIGASIAWHTYGSREARATPPPTTGYALIGAPPSVDGRLADTTGATTTLDIRNTDADEQDPTRENSPHSSTTSPSPSPVVVVGRAASRARSETSRPPARAARGGGASEPDLGY